MQPVCKKWAALTIYNVEVFIYDILLAEVDSSIRALAVARKTLRSDSEHWEINNSRSLYADVVRSWGKMQESADPANFIVKFETGATLVSFNLFIKRCGNI